MLIFYVLRYVLRFGECYALPSVGTGNRNTSAKRKTVLRFARSQLHFGSYAVEINITFCVKLLRFGLSSYVLGNVTFCGPTRAINSAQSPIGRNIAVIRH